MNPLLQIVEDLKKTWPQLIYSIDEPEVPEGAWFLDLELGIVVEWRTDRGFGVSVDPGCYGEGPEKVYSSAEETCERVTQALEEKNLCKEGHRVHALRVWTKPSYFVIQCGCGAEADTAVWYTEPPKGWFCSDWEALRVAGMELARVFHGEGNPYYKEKEP